MCRVARCCLCLPLRIGAYLALGYTLLVGILSLAGAIWQLTSALPVARDVAIHKLEDEHRDWRPEDIVNAVDAAINIERVVFIVCIIIYGLWILFAALMGVGLAKMQRGYLMPWIVMTWILLALGILGLIITIRTLASANAEPSTFVWIQVVVLSVIVLCNGFAVCGVQSYYRNNLKEGDESLVENEMPPAADFRYKNMA